MFGKYAYLKFTRRVILKVNRRKKILYVWQWMLTRLTVVIIS